MMLVAACAHLILPSLLIAMGVAQQAPIVSPEVHADRTITFRYKDPTAKKVEVALEGGNAVEMSKDDKGVWTYTTPRLAPDLYGYNFTSDGETRMDIHNPYGKPNLIWPSNIVLIPGSPTEPWEVRNVPHGTIHHHFYHSNVIGDDRDYFVYTPPGYGAGAKLPVLYLLHGYSDMASGWTEVGKANYILDSLIADGLAKPMVVVMTLGYGVPGFASPNLAGFSDKGRTTRNYDNFQKALLTEVMPAVEKTYRVSTNKRDRAIAGLSMGGAETLLTGLNHLDTFSYVGAFSTGGLDSDFAKAFPGFDGAAANKKLKILYVACGTEDGLIGSNRKLVEWLRGQKAAVTVVETTGRHTWMVWRRNLIAFAKIIF